MDAAIPNPARIAACVEAVFELVLVARNEVKAEKKNKKKNKNKNKLRAVHITILIRIGMPDLPSMH